MSATSKITRANVKTHARRYIATGLAVIISMMFVAASLVVSGGITGLLTRSITDQFTGAAAEISATAASVSTEESSEGSDSTSDDIHKLAQSIASVPGVSSTAVQMETWNEIKANNHTVARALQAINPQPFFQPHIAEGRLPKDGEILLDENSAKTLAVKIGDSVSLEVFSSSEGSSEESSDDSTGNAAQSGADATSSAFTTLHLTVSGLSQAGIMSIPSAYVTPHTATDMGAVPTTLLVASSDTDTSPQAQDRLVAKLQQQLGPNSNFEVQAVHTSIENQLEEIKAGSAVMTALLLIFPVIALVVAAIVVHTTFQVVLEQRRRELALLRALGATSKQVRSILMRETFTVGFVSSLIGVILGAVLGVFAVYTGGMATSWRQAVETLSPVTLLLALAVGTVITVLVGLRPALGMSRQRPLVALSPINQTAPAARKRHTVRLVIGLVGLALCLALIAWSLSTRSSDTSSSTTLWIFMACFFAGMAGLVFAILAASVLLPHLTNLAGRALGNKPVARMARENTRRNPDRTAATGTGIIIGVTLIVLMMTGGLSSKATLVDYLNEARPIDLVITAPSHPSELGGTFQDKLRAVDGVEAVTAARGTTVQVKTGQDGIDHILTSVIEVPDLSSVARNQKRLTPPPPAGSIQVGETLNQPDSLPQTMEVCGTASCQTLNVITAPIDSSVGLVAPQTLEQLAGDQTSAMPITQVYVRLSDTATVDNVLDAIQHLGEDLSVTGGAQERATYLKAINAILGATVGLLAVSVLVALVGLANTLSLSVAERTRENGLLRALGLSKRQMQNMLRLEATLIALVAALVGTIFGVALGWLGMEALPFDGGMTRIIVIPWWQIGAVVVIAIIAALVSSWLPGRRAARTSPVEALATE